MIKTAYQAIPVVDDFGQWLADNLETAALSHRYTNRRTGDWSCASLYDAYRQYRWPAVGGNTFAHNVSALAALKTALQAAVSDPAACAAAIAVMKWGGVSAGNVRWLLANEAGLAKTIRDVRDALDMNDTGLIPQLPAPLRFNAGMTKVYSLICRELIIYDSRVAAALGWAVTLYCSQRDLSAVPAELNFPWAPAKSAPGAVNPKCRNPSTGELVFQKLTPGVLHAEWNLKATWVLDAALSKAAANSGFVSLPAGDRLRAMEAALFMIGYDLPMFATATQPVAAVGDDWHECFTKSHQKPFDYRISPTGIRNRPGGLIPVATINATLEWLHGKFENAPFPLANDVIKARQPDEPLGLGYAYYQYTRRNPGETSKLAAVLEDVQLIERVVVSDKRGLHWQLSDELLALTSSSGTDIAPWISEFIEAQSET